MNATAIVESLTHRVPPGSIEVAEAGDGMPSVTVAREHLVDVVASCAIAPTCVSSSRSI